MKKIFMLACALCLSFSCSKKAIDMEVGETIHGFKLIQKDFVKDVDSTVLKFEHVKTGAILINMANEDINRVFAISFNTYPKDSFGLPHILEHSVLMGSKNFPARTTFEELSKGSFSTYLNAYTAPDHTTYPIATINSKEFKNLMHLYLDAVFYPNVAKNEMLMRQEGIRLVYNEQKKQLEYQGVVLNEMKGVQGKPERQLHETIRKSIYPNTTYEYISGGDPVVMQGVTYQNLVDFHARHYTPSNSVTLIYGKDDVTEHLKFIDENYFSKFEKNNVEKEQLVANAKVTKKHVETLYNVNAIGGDNQHYYTLSYVLPHRKNQELSDDMFGLSVVADLLTLNPKSPLSKALIDNGIGTYNYAYLSNNLPNSLMTFYVGKTKAGLEKKFHKIVADVLNDVAQNGFAQDEVDGYIRQLEFKLREKDTGRTPLGISFVDVVTDIEAYDLDLMKNLKITESIERLKANVKDPKYLPGLLTKYIINNDQSIVVNAIPKAGIAKAEVEAEERALDKKLKEMTKEELQKIKDFSLAFKKFQDTPPTVEDLAKIPRISVKDIDNYEEQLPQKVIKDGTTTYLYHPLNTRGITYLNFFFDASSLDLKDAQIAALIEASLEEFPTKTKTVKQIQTEKGLHTGYAFNKFAAFEKYKKPEELVRVFQYKAGTLDENLDKTVDFIFDIVQNTVYRDYDELLTLLKRVKASMHSGFMYEPVSTSIQTAQAMESTASNLVLEASSYPFYFQVCDWIDNFDKVKEELASRLEEVSARLFTQNNLVVGITSDAENESKTIETLKSKIAKLPLGDGLKVAKIEKRAKERVGIVVPGKVQYVTYVSKTEPFANEGAAQILASIIGDEFLHPEIRQASGAYGAYASLGDDGVVLLYSYRDPNSFKTVDTFTRVPAFLKSAKINQDMIDKFIIGSVKDYDTPKTNKQKGATAANRYLTGLSQDERNAIRTSIINTTVKDVEEVAKNLEKINEHHSFVITGTEEEINSNDQKFDRIISIAR